MAALQCAAAPPSLSPSPSALRDQGEYLALVAGCASCHTDPNGGRPFAGARSVPSPFGPIVTTNITPDKEAGIGRYTFADFERALRDGVTPSGRRLYPAMPYTAYTKMREEDLQALYVYLMEGVEPVPVKPPETKLPFPFNQRWMLRLWQLAFLKKGVYEPEPGRDAAWNRGAYLVQSTAHCGSCHTPRGMGYQERGENESSSQFLAGTVTNDWFAPNLTGDSGAGLGRIDQQAVASFLKNGKGGGLVAYGTMAETVNESLRYLSEEDANAIAGYLKSLPAQQPSGQYEPKPEREQWAEKGNHTAGTQSVGAAVYAGFCAQCHQQEGGGLPPGIPRLAGNPSVLGKDTTSLIRLVLEGGRAAQTTDEPPSEMPSFNRTLNDVQIAQVLTHIRTNWGNDARPVSSGDVAKLRRKLKRPP